MVNPNNFTLGFYSVFSAAREFYFRNVTLRNLQIAPLSRCNWKHVTVQSWIFGRMISFLEPLWIYYAQKNSYQNPLITIIFKLVLCRSNSSFKV